ncbi:hypothetical protein SAMN05216413_2397 [Ruminococcaceae bacterium KH2T8]|nr:hypothetical protein SAMN05216413_2397 [Ruminococcaceae bacterium KH2T8]
MASSCKNCGATLVFHPDSQLLVCEYCNSSFRPEEIETEQKASVEEQQAVSMNEAYGTEDEKLLDCYIYTCNHCGGEIIINGTEASTKCIYCGNSAVVFSRISKQRRPDVVLPFTVTKEKAIELIRNRFNKGRFIPQEVKNFQADHVRGIYIPYWIVDAEHTDAVVVKGSVGSGKNRKTVYYGRAGSMQLHDLPLDASTLLSDESSMRLEPFDFTALREFDEDYLMGFYSNVTDINFGDLKKVVNSRADEFFRKDAMNDVKGASGKSVVASNPHTAIDYGNMRYAMLPAWFVTFDYQGKHHTVLVNGQSGKIICGLPWNKKLFYSMLAGIGVGLTALNTFILNFLLPPLLTSSGSEDDDGGNIIIILIVACISLFAAGLASMKRTIKSIELTQSKSIFNFVKKRQ